MTLKLFDLFDDPNDVRRDWNICEYYYRNGEKLWRNLNNKQYVYCNAGKFRREYELSDTKDKDYTPINFPVLRYSDVLLMLAEAENEACGGPTTLAYECITRCADGPIPTIRLSQVSVRRISAGSSSTNGAANSASKGCAVWT